MSKKSKYSKYYEKGKLKYFEKMLRDNPKGGVKQAAQKMCEHFGLEYNRTVERKYQLMYKGPAATVGIVKPEESDEFKEALHRKFDPTKRRYIITWAQIETPLHILFWENLKAYAEFINAGIHVIAGRYKNPNSLESSKGQERKEKNINFWSPELRPYLDANRQKIHKYLSILSDVKIQPTAIKPLSSIEGFTGLESCIVGHPKVHMRSLPILDGYPNKLMWTTGACTLENYTDTKAGKRGHFNHQIGFAVVEIDESADVFHVRQVQAVDADGSFMDLKYQVRDGQVLEIVENFPAMVLGDIHLGSENKKYVKLSLEFARKFKVENVILHDIFDGHSVNHHEQNNPFIQLEREKDGSDNLGAEIDYMLKFLARNSDLNLHVVRANHDDFLDRWLINTDWRKSKHKEVYWSLGGLLASGKAPKGIIPHLIENHTSAKSFGYNDSLRVLDWELGLHGDKGPNGSRGNLNQFKTLNTKTVTAHSHTPGREDGALSVGTLTLRRLGYNKGLSSWFESNVLIYPNGKAHHINIVKGKFTTLF